MKVIVSILIAFIFSFSLLLLLNSMFFDSEISINENQFWEEKFDEKEKIFLLGSSHIGQLNATHIEEEIKLVSDVEVFNLAYASDNPSKRIETIDKIIRLKPSMIVYGITYLELNSEEKDSFPTLETLYDNYIVTNFPQLEIKNPKWTTLKVSRILLEFIGVDIQTREILKIKNTPFYNYQKQQTIIVKNFDLNESKEFPKIDLYIPIGENTQKIKDLKIIIKKFKENNIEIVIIITPIFKTFLDSLDSNSKKYFHEKLKNISNEFKVDVIDFSERYNNYEIWMDASHIALNEKSEIFSEDIAEIIKKRLK